MASEREERLARNEALFREGNERMATWEERHRTESVELYFCECADTECGEKVRLRQSDYERVRGDASQFVVLPGHEVPDVERVVESHDEWAMIEKDPNVRAIAEETDPRRG